jgi:DNA-binding winged helix-turn-helix (wHTH) protein
MEFRIRAAVNRAIDAGMITKNAAGRMEATPFGQAVAAKGISISTAQDLAKWIHESETRLWSDIDLILAAALTPDGRVLQVALTSAEYEHADYPGMLKRLTQDEDLSADVPMNRLRNCNLMPFFEEVRAIKIALILAKWIDEASVYDLEEEFHSLMGQITAASEQVAWLIDATAAIAAAFGAQSEFIERIGALSERVAHGLREEALPVARLRLHGLDRTGILALEAHGLHLPNTLAHAAPGLLAQWLPPRQVQTLQAWAKRNAKLHPEAAGSPTQTPAASPPLLVVDDRHPNEIRLDGHSIRLQEKQYRLIRTLAAAPGECVPYETIYTAVWGDTIVEPNQMHFQKRRLLDRIKEAVPSRADLVKTIPKRGFVLDLTAAQVALLTPATSTAA